MKQSSLTKFPDSPVASTVDAKIFDRILRTSITLPLLLMTAITAIFIGLIFHLMANVRSVEHANIVIANSHKTLNVLLDAETGMRGFLLSGKEEFLEPYYNATTSIDLEIKNLEGLVMSESDLLLRLDHVKEIYRKWNAYAQENIELRRRENEQFLKRVTSGQGKRFMDEIRHEFAEFIRTKERIRNERSETTQSTIRLVILIMVFVSLLTGFFLALFSRRQLKSLSALFGDALDKQRELNQLLLLEDWNRTGLSELKDLSRGDNSLQELTTKIINHLAKYTGAQVGAFYVVSETKGILNRVATYAFSIEAEAKPSEVKLSEGLVGQAAAENRLIQVLDLPDNYIQINSSLGSSIPKALLIAPASEDGTVNSVIELGFLNPPDARIMELLENASPAVALTIRAWQDRTRIQDLLEEAQTFNEELQTQQEELRTSNEELEAQSLSLQDSRAELEQNNESLKEAQTLLEEQSDEALKASRYKSEFLANMSHELRTPLNSSLILSKLLADNTAGNLTVDQVKYASSIFSSGNDLLLLINDILDLSKVEAGMLEIRDENVSLPKVLKNLENTFQSFADQKQIKFLIKMDAGVPETIITDQQRLEQILKNLLSNAFKFTDEGQVTFHVSHDSDGILSMAVIDTGIGVQKSQQRLIFDAFHQADGTDSRKYGGTGLGLSISRDLAKLLDGTIEIESVLGAGSRFTLLLNIAGKETLPVIQEEKKKPRAEQFVRRSESKLPHKIKRILIVEDDQLQRESMVKLIDNPDLEITAVALGNDALKELKTTVYDCIVIDLKLPDMSGEQLLKKMSELDDLSAFPPVIVYTGRSLSLNEEDQIRKFSRSIIIKGARSPERLLDEVGLILHHVEPDHHPERQKILNTVRSRDDVFKDKKILVVDDDVRNIFAMTAALEQRGVHVVIARNGREALSKLAEDPHMDLILMDIMMPEMDGYEATREIRKQKRFAKLPIIAVTAKATKKDQTLCMEAGANDYMAKPIDLHQLFSLLRVWMPNVGSN